MSEISIVMPARDRGEMIKEAIDSVLKQTEQNWELIIVDDHSGPSDKTEKVIDTIGDRRIKYYKLPDENGIGIVAARNFGNVMASSPYIAVLDSDDLALPNRIKLTLLEFQKGADLVYGRAIYLNKETKQEVTQSPENKARPFDPEVLKKANYIAHSTVAYRRQIGLDFPYNSFFRKGEDYEFYGRVSKYGFKFSFVDRDLVIYRIHDNSTILGNSELKYTDTLKKVREWI